MGTTVSASGNFAVPMEALRNSVAASSTFQTITGAANEAAAKDYVYIFEADDRNDQEDEPIPRAVVGYESWSMESLAREISATAYVLFQFTISTDYKDNQQDAAITMANNCDAILEEMIVKGRAGGTYLYITSVELVGMAQIKAMDGNPVNADHNWEGEFLLEYT